MDISQETATQVDDLSELVNKVDPRQALVVCVAIQTDVMTDMHCDVCRYKSLLEMGRLAAEKLYQDYKEQAENATSH